MSTQTLRQMASITTPYGPIVFFVCPSCGGQSITGFPEFAEYLDNVTCDKDGTMMGADALCSFCHYPMRVKKIPDAQPRMTHTLRAHAIWERDGCTAVMLQCPKCRWKLQMSVETEQNSHYLDNTVCDANGIMTGFVVECAHCESRTHMRVIDDELGRKISMMKAP